MGTDDSGLFGLLFTHSPPTATRISSSGAFFHLVSKPEISVIFSVAFSRIRVAIAKVALPNIYEST